MIEVNKHILDNGLRVLHHRDVTTQMVALNILYDVGSKDEDPNRTGFAHLFEHLMFGGSCHIPDFDAPLQSAGGENNAWTSNDITNYYSVVPCQNMETAFWLESDRMLQLDFSERSLEVQKQVVVEEFKQRNLNQPYGDISLLMRPLAYQVHPYQWSTIGKEVEHIENATLEEVKGFFFSHYAPNNAILAITGNITFDEAITLSQKWFGPIESREIKPRCLPQEPPQTEARFLEVERDVPLDSLKMSFHMCGRAHADYPYYDFISDILANGRSARFYQNLVMEQKVFAELDAAITGDIDPGVFQISGKPSDGVTLDEARDAVWRELTRLCDEPVGEYELEKVLNRFESNDLFASINYLHKATQLAYFELLGDYNLINTEVEKYRQIVPADLQRIARLCFRPENCSTLYYKAKK